MQHQIQKENLDNNIVNNENLNKEIAGKRNEEESKKDKNKSKDTESELCCEEKSQNNKLEEFEAKKIVESITDSITSGDKRDIEESTKDIVKKAAQAVGSLKETEFDIRFNPDVFSPRSQTSRK